MPYRWFIVMLRAGIRRAAYNRFRLLEVLSIPQMSEQADRERMINALMAEAGILGGSDRGAEQDLAALDQLRTFFPPPSPEMAAAIRRAREATP